VLNLLKLFARENNCYKVILDCDENIKKVYSKNGFIIKGVQMAEYLVAEHPK
jgi:glucosamine-phosphate N-acetyltransferase